MRHPPRRFAFFDVDDTLIAIKSMFDFFPFWCEEMGLPQAVARFECAFAHARSLGKSREDLNRLYYRFLRGASLNELRAIGAKWFAHRFRCGPSPYHDATVARLREHRAQGIAPVFVSGSMLPLLQPIADDLEVEHCLCTQLLLDRQGLLTGEIGAPQTIGTGKAVAIHAFLRTHAIDPSECLAYGDDNSDLPMLEAVGHPVVVGVAADLLALAHRRGWQHVAL